MVDYRIEFSYVEPMIGEVDLTAKDETEAREFALDTIEQFYPEANDIEVIKVTEIGGK